MRGDEEPVFVLAMALPPSSEQPRQVVGGAVALIRMRREILPLKDANLA